MLLLRLYELRREPAMRDARNWFVREFNPESAADVKRALRGPMSARFRMVSTYWDMAASLVLNGAVDEQMFNDANGEQVVVFAKIQPFLAEYRTSMGPVARLSSLEKLVMRTPDADQRLASVRDRFRALAAAAAEEV